MKSKIPYYLIGLIVTFMLLDIAFVTLAKMTYTGIYTENHYKKGMDFNRIYSSEIYKGEHSWNNKTTINTILLVDELKLPLDISTPQELSFYLTDHQNKPISNAKVIGKLIRPVTDKHDSAFTLQETSRGNYSTKINFPLKGQWHIRIKAILDDKEYISTARIIVN
jgi:nitrogen fixation protein FixH